MMRRIGIVGGDMAYARPFNKYGSVIPLGVGQSLKDFDLIVFTGGEDVNPSLYGETFHPATVSNINRDMFEIPFYTKARDLGVPMVGICRGSQFLTVMNGGKLHQHIHRHGISGTHPITTWKGEVIQVTSTHHQMMIPFPDDLNLRSDKETEILAYTRGIAFDVDIEPEVVWYSKTKCLAVQYHPEYMDLDSRGYTYFQQLLEEYVL